MAGEETVESLRPLMFSIAYRMVGSVSDAEDVVQEAFLLYGDGGGKGPSWLKPIVGPDRVARLLIGSGQQFGRAGIELRRRQVNGQPGAVVVDSDGRLVSVFTLDIVDGAVQTVCSVIKPEKLGHLGPLANVTGLMLRGRR